MLGNLGLDKTFGTETVNTSVYIRNRSPHKKFDKTSEKIWSGVRKYLGA